mgnify:CR=1 FL=1|jgi:hypothetical protein
MNIRTRHIALMTYSGLTALIIAKDILTDPTHIIGLMTPIVALWTYDKIQSHVSDSSRGE